MRPETCGLADAKDLTDGGLSPRFALSQSQDLAIVIVDVFSNKTRKTPANVIERCKQRLRGCDEAVGTGRNG